MRYRVELMEGINNGIEQREMKYTMASRDRIHKSVMYDSHTNRRDASYSKWR